MKITKTQLKRIIKEELQQIMDEGWFSRTPKTPGGIKYDPTMMGYKEECDRGDEGYCKELEWMIAVKDCKGDEDCIRRASRLSVAWGE